MITEIPLPTIRRSINDYAPPVSRSALRKTGGSAILGKIQTALLGSIEPASTTAKINGVAANPPRWPDGTYSVQGAAAAIGVTAQTIFDYLAQGLVHGRQSTKGQPWQISLSSDQIDQLQRRLQRTRRSRKGAS
ncbi:hypothetical protein [Mesorhizobium sp. M0159]|uniref:hypothetical protein n=1 Tax=Mesorhizobium sp. M0159 TaxID=2956900 RepID=UPI00333AFDD2